MPKPQRQARATRCNRLPMLIGDKSRSARVFSHHQPNEESIDAF
jgi:hypothetical protein